jgi:uncharacterized protein (TIGR02284 family)
MSSGDINGSGTASYQNFTKPDPKNVRGELDSYLRGEISAAETYRMALDSLQAKSPPPVDVSVLRDIQQEHGRAAQALRERIRQLGGEASDSSGLWGSWAKLATSVANFLGDAATLKALKEGEEHGRHEYDEALEDLDVTSAELLSTQLIPAQQRHIEALDRLIKAAEAG